MNTPNWNQHTHFVALDWATEKHQIVVLDTTGQIVEDFVFKHEPEEWRKCRQRLAAYPRIVLAVESGSSVVVEQLLLLGRPVYVVPAKSSRGYRQRKLPSGIKNDFVDAWCLASALRSEGADWRSVHQPDEITLELRHLCRDQVALIGQRTMIVNQLIATLREYYPVAVAAFDDWTAPFTWAFLERFPSTEALHKAGQRSWEKFLHTHGLARPTTYQKRLNLFADKQPLAVNRGVVEAKRLQAISFARILKVIQAQIEEYDQCIHKVFLQHPDHALFSSLPAAGRRIAPRLLGEIGANREAFPSCQSLQCHAGTAPASFQSGQIHKVAIRRACNKHLRAAVHLWANLSIQFCPWAKVYYQTHRDRGKSHACALRSVGQRWLKILWKMWQSNASYDPELHARNQLKHGSWVLKLMQKPAEQGCE